MEEMTVCSRTHTRDVRVFEAFMRGVLECKRDMEKVEEVGGWLSVDGWVGEWVNWWVGG